MGSACGASKGAVRISFLLNLHAEHLQQCRRQAGWVPAPSVRRAHPGEIWHVADPPAPDLLPSARTHVCKRGDAGCRGQEPPAEAGLQGRAWHSLRREQRSSHGNLQRRRLVPARAPFCGSREVKGWTSASRQSQALALRGCGLGKRSLSTHNFSIREENAFQKPSFKCLLIFKCFNFSHASTALCFRAPSNSTL